VETVIGAKPNILVGNKIDLANQGNREVGKQDGESFKNELNSNLYFETSAKDGNQIEKVFENITLSILKASNKI